MHNMYTTIRSRLNAIQELPIYEHDKRQSMLVDLMALIVNHETENGEPTSVKRNTQMVEVDKQRIAQGMPLLIDDILQARLQG